MQALTKLACGSTIQNFSGINFQEQPAPCLPARWGSMDVQIDAAGPYDPDNDEDDEQEPGPEEEPKPMEVIDAR